ncbi:pseudouridine synthase [Psychroflexus maritimus]|uniref:Pseudouridine synthase n=1 Tax=Psychroflexus maritimus TaxID=2714865 RepID=A0A967E3N2_9FLAO|nr:pseudouridine synthase [Psychroflexus maritimus]NGZ90874.1 pseudouridine synthase [Psychroflexus maritimus]
MEKPVRINKYLSQIGFCSRRKADALLEEKRIKVNGKNPELGTKVLPSDSIEVDGQLIGEKDKENEFVYLLLNKPRGIVCTTDQKREKDNIIDFVNYHKRVFPVGRLDKMSEGLIMLTNDGEIVNKILRAKNKNEKEYLVQVNQPITSDFIERMKNGVPILGTITKKSKVDKISETEFKIVLTQGLNRQIRRMCEALGYQVRRLTRIRIMHLKLDFPQGTYREMSPEEVSFLKKELQEAEK